MNRIDIEESQMKRLLIEAARVLGYLAVIFLVAVLLIIPTQ